VEDETALREAGANYLRARGYEVLTAANGEEAIALALEDSTRPHVLVTDVMMPGLTGPELAQVLCELKPGLRVLFMSGFPADSPAHELLGPAAGAYLQKPFSFHTLSERLEALLKDDGTLSQTLP
jgi:DNA-binding response OmpR family regulator